MKDKKMNTTTTITKSVFFTASRETVWEFLVQKDKLGEWFHTAEADLVEGQEYRLFTTGCSDSGKDTHITGRVLELSPPSKLVTTFVIAPFQGRETTVTWLLEEVPGGTKLTLTHVGVAEAAGAAAINLLLAIDAGWDKHNGQLRGLVNS